MPKKQNPTVVSGGPVPQFIQHHYRHFNAAAREDATIVAPLIFAQVPGW